jgi:PBP1b-binding outer membrane lipoprotein LpoB
MKKSLFAIAILAAFLFSCADKYNQKYSVTISGLKNTEFYTNIHPTIKHDTIIIHDSFMDGIHYPLIVVKAKEYSVEEKKRD